jgi:glycosyltransferase involved in cell wall biosynthesis
MRICFLSNVNSPHTKKWCSYFSMKQHEVHLISFDDGEIENVCVHHIDVNITRNSSRLKKMGYLFCSSKVKKLLDEIQPDILHAHRATGYAFVAGMSNFHPYILSVWGGDVYDLPKNILYKRFVQYNLNKADYIFSTSKAMKNQVHSLVDKEVIVTPFGVNTKVFRPIVEIKSEKRIVIGIVKTLRKEYGIDYLIRAFKVVTLENPGVNMELHIAGKGHAEPQLRELCKELKIDNQVRFLGYLNQEQVVTALNSFDLAVFPSVGNESFGVAAVEAQACGVPVIVSNIGGLPEATAPNYSSILVEKGNVEQLAREISRLVNNHELRKEMGRNAREFVKKTYNIEDNFGEVERIYEKIVGGI